MKHYNKENWESLKGDCKNYKPGDLSHWDTFDKLVQYPNMLSFIEKLGSIGNFHGFVCHHYSTRAIVQEKFKESMKSYLVPYIIEALSIFNTVHGRICEVIRLGNRISINLLKKMSFVMIVKILMKFTFGNLE